MADYYGADVSWITAAALVVVSTVWFLGGGFGMRVPRLALAVRRYRPLVSLFLVRGWFVVRLLPHQPRRSLLEVGIESCEQMKDRLVAWIQETDSLNRFQGTAAAKGLLVPLVHWLWNVAGDVAAILVVAGVGRIVYCLYHYTFSEGVDLAVRAVFEWSKDNVPGIRGELDRQTDSFATTADSVLNRDPNRTLTLSLPPEGRPHGDILVELERHATKEDEKWRGGKVSGTVYSNDRRHVELMAQVYKLYAVGNPLHPGFWPKLNQCEAEVVAMTARMLNAPTSDQPAAAGAFGCVTSGGTESIVLAVRAHLNHYGKRRGIAHPEIICGTTAHAALNKACDMFSIRMVIVDCDDGKTYQLDPAQVRRRITSNTIMIYASAPCYPQGVVDPIAALSKVAGEFQIGLHVDACLGGFVLPFLAASENVPAFDFRCPGVTSISADTHKYGYAAKGTSVVVYRTKELRHAQYFSYPHWTGGMYTTPTIAGSRAGALSVCAWASLVSIGRDGFEQRSRRLCDAARMIARGVHGIPGLKLMTPRPYMVVCFGSSDDVNAVDVYRVQDAMAGMGWSLNELQSPASVHVCVTLNMVPKVAIFLRDLRTAVTHVRKEGSAGKDKGTAGIYGAVGSLPEGPVECVLHGFTDMTLTP